MMVVKSNIVNLKLIDGSSQEKRSKFKANWAIDWLANFGVLSGLKFIMFEVITVRL